MNYRHIYHAGNFADVFKHLILIQLLKQMKQKPKPFCVLDTHAGIGLYDLNKLQATKNKEYVNGIEKLTHASPPAAFNDYLNCVKQFNVHYPQLDFYPGSPMIIKSNLRAIDRLIACELHPEDYLLLKQHFSHDHQCAIHQTDGFAALKAFLPPTEKRGLILIDPAFESKEEFEHIIKAIKIGLQRFANGIYAIWFPIKETLPIGKFYNDLKNLNQPNIIFELNLNDVAPTALNQCGMVILNPPWQFEEEMKIVFVSLSKILGTKTTIQIKAFKK